jgi:hypothetical protein
MIDYFGIEMIFLDLKNLIAEFSSIQYRTPFIAHGQCEKIKYANHSVDSLFINCPIKSLLRHRITDAYYFAKVNNIDST